MKLELKHLKAYLGTNLKIKIRPFSGTEMLTPLNLYVNFESIIPILHPLSDLTKDIEVNGEKFVPCKQFTLDVQEELSACLRDDTYYELLPYFVIQKLYEWHFDIYGLIPSLAIDINTLEL